MQIKSSKKISLLELLSELAPESSKNTLRSWIRMGRVLIGERVASKASQGVEEGDVVQVTSRPKYVKGDLKVLFEDRDLIVIDKPAGLLTVATDKEHDQTAHAILKRRYSTRQIIPIHRLDKDTSGLLVFSCNERARIHLKKQLEERSFRRIYRAIVHGKPGEGTWRSHLMETERLNVIPCSPAKGKEAITHYSTIETKRRTSLIELKLETGRKHQIRVQAASEGFPIVGDSKYGRPEDAKIGFKLQAIELGFVHPRSDRNLCFRVPTCL